VNNLPVHYIKNISIFFKGSTFYEGHGLAPLSGSYYRPLMTTVFSLIYTVFGPHPFYFHLVQLLLFIGSVILLYLVFRYFLKPSIALFLALIFLVHPINSEMVYAIPVLQDTLYFFFGILGLYVLLRFNSIRSVLLVAVCLFLSILSKETGLLFVGICGIYIFWRDRNRLYPYIGMVTPFLILYLFLHHQAVGSLANPHTAPIDNLGLKGRLLTDPSIFLFYIEKAFFPWRLSNIYFWYYKAFSIQHVLIPGIIDLGVICIFVYGAVFVHRRSAKNLFYSYLFFSVWFGLGMILNLQLLPLDCTASEPWFCFAFVGLLGMFGIVIQSCRVKIHARWIIVVMVVIILILGFRTAMRAFDWRSQVRLAQIDLLASPDNYFAYNLIAIHYLNQGNYSMALRDVNRSLAQFPSYSSYNTLGEILSDEGDYSINHGGSDYSTPYENIAQLLVLSNNQSYNQGFMVNALGLFPQDSALWIDYAIIEQKYGNNATARYALTRASLYGSVPVSLSQAVMNNSPLQLNLLGIRDVEI
jgi:tetratricopeptide (TPR) repeat protein